MGSFNKLTPQESERLALLAEECGEVIQIVGKILRHGYESYNPNDPRKTTNRALLEKELGDVSFVSFFMNEKKDIDSENVESYMSLKSMKIGQWLHHQDS